MDSPSGLVNGITDLKAILNFQFCVGRKCHSKTKIKLKIVFECSLQPKGVSYHWLDRSSIYVVLKQCL